MRSTECTSSCYCYFHHRHHHHHHRHRSINHQSLSTAGKVLFCISVHLLLCLSCLFVTYFLATLWETVVAVVMKLLWIFPNKQFSDHAIKFSPGGSTLQWGTGRGLLRLMPVVQFAVVIIVSQNDRSTLILSQSVMVSGLLIISKFSFSYDSGRSFIRW